MPVKLGDGGVHKKGGGSQKGGARLLRGDHTPLHTMVKQGDIQI